MVQYQQTRRCIMLRPRTRPAGSPAKAERSGGLRVRRRHASGVTRLMARKCGYQRSRTASVGPSLDVPRWPRIRRPSDRTLAPSVRHHPVEPTGSRQITRRHSLLGSDKWRQLAAYPRLPRASAQSLRWIELLALNVHAPGLRAAMIRFRPPRSRMADSSVPPPLHQDRAERAGSGDRAG